MAKRIRKECVSNDGRGRGGKKARGGGEKKREREREDGWMESNNAHLAPVDRVDYEVFLSETDPLRASCQSV